MYIWPITTIYNRKKLKNIRYKGKSNVVRLISIRFDIFLSTSVIVHFRWARGWAENLCDDRRVGGRLGHPRREVKEAGRLPDVAAILPQNTLRCHQQGRYYESKISILLSIPDRTFPSFRASKSADLYNIMEGREGSVVLSKLVSPHYLYTSLLPSLPRYRSDHEKWAQILLHGFYGRREAWGEKTGWNYQQCLPCTHFSKFYSNTKDPWS